MHHLLPLGEDEVVLFEVLPQQLHRGLTVLHDYLTVLVEDWSRVEIPPPTCLLEQVQEQLRVVAAADKPFVMLEQLPLEVQLNLVALIQRFVQLGQHLLLGVTDEGLAPKITILGQLYLELLGK